MDEQEWLTCNDLEKMLKSLRGKKSDRKLRLFACACGRTSRPLLAHEGLRQGLEMAERYADGQAAYQDMVAAAKVAERVGWSLAREDRALSNAVWAATAMGLWYWFRPVPRTLRTVRHLLSVDDKQAPQYVALFRDFFGNPFRPVTMNPSCRTPTVLSLAQTIYDQRSFDRLPELAQALQDAGCDEAEFLAHFRSPGPHAKGCWAVDTVLGKS